MKKFLILKSWCITGLCITGLCIAALSLSVAGCSINASKLSDGYAKDFAESVNCATGYKGACFCFVASRKTGNTATTGIGMAIDRTGELCK